MKSVELTLSQGNIKKEVTLYFKDEQEAREYLENYDVEEYGEIKTTYMETNELLQELNDKAERLARLELSRQTTQVAQAAKKDASLWKVSIDGCSPIICRDWVEVQRAITHESNVSIEVKPLSVEELIEMYNDK